PGATPRSAPIRVRGVVRSRGSGLPRIPVTDGVQVVDTAPDGTFELVTVPEQGFVRITLPSGYRIPLNSPGTARFYQPLTRSSEQSAVFELEPDPVPHDDHTLLLLGDIQTQNSTETGWFLSQSVPDLRATAASLGDEHAFGISCGDIMFDNLEFYPDYERGVEQVGIPFFQVVGNHDLDMDSPTDRGSIETFGRHFGPGYYSFNRGAVHYVVLDDVFWYGRGYLGYLDAETLRWLEQDLARVESGSPVIVATHIPVLGSQHLRFDEDSPTTGLAITNREALYRLLEPFDAHVLTGHTHECEHVFEHGTHEHVTGAVCGAWWSGPICHDGTPNGYCVYTIRGEQVSWRYKATGREPGYQMRLHRTGTDPASPGELIANIWNWDPEWTVRWFADGEPRGRMERRRGLDPLSVELHSGPDLPARRDWVEPVPADHLFRAALTGEEREVVVEATDRFGQVYSGEWRR
ncbi:MAG: hypothetical protein F4Z50_13240, partial [Gemmatimonadetes bacterium]|nr:hypothetical protein [Gemmatimonadota bacterium]